MKVVVALGTPSEIVKLAVPIRLLRDAFDVTVVFTGQHYDPQLSEALFRELDVQPELRLRIPRNGVARVGRMLADAMQVMSRERPDLVLVAGDGYTVPVYGLAARSSGCGFVHLEAGLRSFDLRSVDETNRRIGAATALLHLAPTEVAAGFLRREGIESARVKVVGNPVLDTVRERGIGRRSRADRHGVLVTTHRSDGDDGSRLVELVTLLESLAGVTRPILFPARPQTVQRLREANLVARLRWAHVDVTEPLGYSELLRRLAGVSLVITDSGALQEEAAWYGVPVVVLASSTPRWEGVRAGIATLSGFDAHQALDAAATLLTPEAQQRVADAACPYGDGHTSERLVGILADPANEPLLQLTELSPREIPLPA